MAEYTQNYSLKKPLPNEFYDVADQNSNMDKIDSALKKHDDLLDKKVDLDETGKIPQEQLPELDFIPNSEKGQPDGVAPLNKDKVLDIIYGGTKAKTAQEAIYNLGCMPRENLLPNWRFKINQRGKKQYTDYAYSIDGAFFNGGGTVDVHDDYVDITATSDTAILEFKLENPNQYKGKKLTFSLLAQRIAGTGLCYITSIANEYSGEAYANDDLDIISFTKTKAEDITNLTYAIVVAQGNTLRIYAGKFEVGHFQTLGFKDNNGNIHIFEEFDYAKELAKCERYLLDITPNIIFNASYTAVCTEAGVLYTTIPLPVPMRITPTLLAETDSFQIALSDGSFPVPESVSIVTIGGNYIALRFIVSSAQIGQVADIRLIDETKKWLLSAEL